MRRLLLVSLVVGLACSSTAAAQAADELDVAEIDSTAFPDVTATVSVPPSLAGRDLPPEAFAVAENGTTRQPSVERVSGEERAVVLVLDTSGSMAGAPMAAARESAIAFLETVAPATPVGVVGFGAEPVVASPLTLDRDALVTAIGNLEARGETALYDAISLAVAQFSPDERVRRSIVVLSDGGDTASATTLEQAVAALTDSGARLDVAELVTPESNGAALAELATAGGGMVISASDPVALAQNYDALARSLASQYLVTYRSEASGATELSIRLDHDGITAEGRASIDLPVKESALTPVARPEAAEPSRAWSSWGLALGAAAFFVAIALAASVVLLPRAPRAGAARLGRVPPGAARTTALTGLAERASQAAEDALERRGQRQTLDDALERAGLDIRPGEFLVLAFSASTSALLLGTMLGNVFVGLVMAGVIGIGAVIALRHLTRKRQQRFAEQLSDTLQLLAGSLRSGYALVQAFDAVAREGDAPTGEEFRRLVMETRLGRPLPESLRAMSERVGGEDFDWLAGAIEINREVGGDLAEVLDTVGKTIREREQVRRQVKALSADGRYSAYVLMALPVLMVVAMKIINPGYLAELTRGPGIVLSGLAVVLMAAGGLWLRKICRLVF
jgi:tight adherence protein B